MKVIKVVIQVELVSESLLAYFMLTVLNVMEVMGHEIKYYVFHIGFNCVDSNVSNYSKNPFSAVYSSNVTHFTQETGFQEKDINFERLPFPVSHSDF